MFENDQQEVLLMAIEYLKILYGSLQNPCFALHISRYYNLLANLNIAKNKREGYAKQSKSWLTCHINSPWHSQKMQNQLNHLVQLHECNSLTL
ncbi:MAG: hypothetical protein CTY34_00490 [Methylobacter sp.]|nr:MAG: hypothetical protein CTY34_00490 [Methylobacter sp.]